MKVLFLTAWYPNRYDDMAGLFVRKHALAVSQSAEVCVLYIHPDEHIGQTEIVTNQIGNLKEVTVYHPFIHAAALKKISKACHFCTAFKQGFAKIQQWFGRPDIVHVNVLTRCGVLAWWMNKRYNIPYVITEHWSRYLPQNFSYTGALRKWATTKVVHKASAVMPVCENLSRAMSKCGLEHPNYHIVPNVVDSFFYQSERPSHTKGDPFTLLHVSCFDEKSKNVKGTLRAFRQLLAQRNNVKIRMIGTGTGFNEAVALAQQLDFPKDSITFTGELPPEAVCHEMQNANALVLFSNYENAPVVISEALATGLPVIASNIGGIPEMVPTECGLLVEPGNERELTERIIQLLDNYDEYNSQTIRQQAERYRFESVRDELMSIYSKAMEETATN